jgi:UDPglucose--hexose-1-phosphate uridylyltransferase
MERTPLPERDPTCPFCPGNEEETPPEISRSPGDPEWCVRVMPNLFAALGSAPSEARAAANGGGATNGAGPNVDGELFAEIPGAGSHEVIVESPRHDARLDELEETEVARVVEMWRSRYRSLIDRPEIRAVVVFKNFGPLAGTSLAHTHSQVIATPVALPALATRVAVAERYEREHRLCVYEALVDEERGNGNRIVEELEGFTVLAPFASAAPFECWIVPTRHASSFGKLQDEDVAPLSRAIVRSLGAIRRACADPDFNLMVYSAEPEAEHDGEGGAFHWFVRVVPKLTTPAGFELGSAMSINTVAPEDAAAALREAIRAGAAR